MVSKINANKIVFSIFFQARNLPYFVARTKNHMLPVYLKEEVRGESFGQNNILFAVCVSL